MSILGTGHLGTIILGQPSSDNLSPSDSLVLNESVLVNIIKLLSVPESLTFSDETFKGKFTTVSDTLIFSDTVTKVRLFTDSISFTETKSVSKIVRCVVSELLVFSDEDTELTNRNKVKRIKQVLSFVELAQANKTVYQTLNDSILFQDQNYRLRYDKDISDILTFSETATRYVTKYRTNSDILTFTETVELDKKIYLKLFDIMSFVDDRNRNIYLPPGYISPTVVLPPDEDLPPEYEGMTVVWPQGNPPTTTITIPRLVYPNIAKVTEYITLNGKTAILILPTPEFNDHYSNQSKVIFKKMMDGSTRTYKKSSAYDKLHYDFVITSDKVSELKEFILAEQGNEITIDDWQGYKYRAKILTDSIDFEYAGLWEPCGEKVRVTIEFMVQRYV